MKVVECKRGTFVCRSRNLGRGCRVSERDDRFVDSRCRVLLEEIHDIFGIDHEKNDVGIRRFYFLNRGGIVRAPDFRAFIGHLLHRRADILEQILNHDVAERSQIPTDERERFGFWYFRRNILKRAGKRVVGRRCDRAPEVRFVHGKRRRAARAVDREDLVFFDSGKRGAEVGTLRRQHHRRFRGPEFAHGLPARLRITRLIIFVNKIERRTAECGDVFRGELEDVGPMAAIDRTRAREWNERADIIRLAFSTEFRIDIEEPLHPRNRTVSRAEKRKDGCGCRRREKIASGELRAAG